MEGDIPVLALSKSQQEKGLRFHKLSYLLVIFVIFYFSVYSIFVFSIWFELVCIG